LAADISLGAANGVRAVVYVQRQLAAMPQLRPLVLVVKAFLRQHNLNEARRFCKWLSNGYTAVTGCA